MIEELRRIAAALENIDRRLIAIESAMPRPLSAATVTFTYAPSDVELKYGPWIREIGAEVATERAKRKEAN